MNALAERVIGVHDTGRPGPLLLALGGIHGNEPAGVAAIRSVLGVLAERAPILRGRFVGVAGNLGALAAKRRFLARDLNRGWLAADVAALLERDPTGDCAEDREQRELLACFESALSGAHGPAFFVDCHTSSADGPPFLCCTETAGALRLALALGVPTLLGIGGTIAGAVLEWWSARGVVGLAVEGGRHDDPRATAVLAAALWCALEDCGLLEATPALELDRHRSLLRRAAAGLPQVVEVFHRHPVASGDGFVMEPGWRSFDAAAAGRLLARDRGGEIRTAQSCRVLLPLYQGQGEDGFFLGRDVPPHRVSESAP